MGSKSRGNWNINFCMKSDCANRDTKCKECIRFSNYKKEYFFDTIKKLDEILDETNKEEQNES